MTPDRSPDALLLWPFAAARVATQSMRWWLDAFGRLPADADPVTASDWTTPNEVALQLTSMQLRDFSAGADGQPALVCAPFALHRALIADFAPGHSIVETLRANGVARVFVTDWRSATAEMRYLSIDSYLADLNVAVDEIGPPVDLVGLCQGGWLALVYAARFPHKVRRLVLAGAPIDMRAVSDLSRLAAALPTAGFDELVRSGDGIVSGRHMSRFWSSAQGLDPERAVQRALGCAPEEGARHLERFRNWDRCPLDLPGTYYLEVAHRIFRENQIAEDKFVALGRTVRLSDVTVPLFLLTAADDEIVPAAQTLAAARLVATPAALVEAASEPCMHLALFMGTDALRNSWPQAARWLAAEAPAVPDRKTAAG
jgi:poly(3-hydroxyalkanoate) synthetase